MARQPANPKRSPPQASRLARARAKNSCRVGMRGSNTTTNNNDNKVMRGWRNTVGDLIEVVWLENKSIAGLDSLVHAWKPEGYGFIEFEISNSSNLHPLIINPPNKKRTIKKCLGTKYTCYYQFRRRHDYPPHKKTKQKRTIFLVKPPPNTKNWQFCCWP